MAQRSFDPRSDETHAREERIFTAVLSWPPEERPGRLQELCAGDEALARAIEGLLREHERSRVPVDTRPALTFGCEVISDAAAFPALDSRAGSYELGEKLGEGGWGAVYAARQHAPVRRDVAIKIIKLGMDTRAVVARFQAERQALALMDHPGIARVFDAGETAAGRPFFVMERVHGARITEYCEAGRLTLAERLGLFAKVCQAVQHAHQRGVIHRDLKPSNILVSEVDGMAVPKVIDFGIAKATQGRLGDETLVTEVESFIGTPVYMSPEQAGNAAGDIDTRADVYSLGVLLYELLVGCTPLAAEELRGLRADEARRRIIEVVAVRPSQKLAEASPAVIAEVAARRQMTAGRLRSTVTGDLDWIALKCLERDRARRYESAAALAADIQGFLNHEAVAARPPSKVYEWGRFVRRHRVAFAIAAVIAISLTVTAVVSTAMYWRERESRERALSAEREQSLLREQAQAQARKAEVEAARSAEFVRFTKGMLQGIGPSAARGRDVSVLREMLQGIDTRLSRELVGKPEVEAELRATIAEIYNSIWETEAAEAMQRQTVALRIAAHGLEHPAVARALQSLGDFIANQKRYREAEESYRMAVDLTRRLHGADAREVISPLSRLAMNHGWLRDIGQSRALWLEIHALQIKHYGPNDPGLSLTELWFARLLHREGKFPEAAAALRALLESRADLVPVAGRSDELGLPGKASLRPPTQEGVLVELSRTVSRMGVHAETEKVAKRAIALQEQKYDVHPEVLMILGKALFYQKRFGEAAATYERAIAGLKDGATRDPRNTRFIDWLGETLVFLADAQLQLGEWAAAEKSVREGLETWQKNPTYVGSNPDPMALLATALEKQGRIDDALTVSREALAGHDRTLSHQIYYSLLKTVQLLQVAGSTREVAEFWQAREERLRGFLASPAGDTVDAHVATQLQAMIEAGEGVRAERLARAHHARWQAFDRDQWALHGFRALAGAALLQQKRYEEAETPLREGALGMHRHRATLPMGAMKLRSYELGQVARLYSVWKKSDRLAEWTKWRAANP